MKIETNGTSTRFVAESPEEIRLISSSKILISLIELRLNVQKIGMLPDYNGELIADPTEFAFISNELHKKRDHFDVILESTNRELSVKKLKHCYVSQSYPKITFHCDGIE